MHISVIVAVKNGERFIRQALESIFSQSYSPFEVLVIDGHSTDRTLEIARSFPTIKVLKQQDPGLSAAYNEGIAAARGELIAFLSHDDVWHKEKLEKQVQLLTARPDIDYVICRARFFLEDPQFLPPGFRPELLEKDSMAPIMETLLARRALFDRIGLFDSAYVSSDVDWFSRAHDCGIKGEALAETLLYKRVHGQNTTFNNAKIHEELLDILKNSIRRKKTCQ